MERVSFQQEEIGVLRLAIAISEELISEFFKISTSEWKRYRYDIQSLKDLSEDEITDLAFAQIRRYVSCPHERRRGSEPGDYFKICLQDHRILNALSNDARLGLLPFVTYIVTHELIHVVRFAKFLHRFHTTEAEREEEERRVHALTLQLLVNQKIEGLPEVLTVFRNHGAVETLM